MFWSKKFDPAQDIADLTGKVVVVSGANTGIGYTTVKHLARRGAKVYLGARSEEKGRAAIEQLKVDGIGAGKVIWLPCSFNTPALAKESAEHFLKLENRLDILINNAGCISTGGDKPAQDGITEMMMVNHIGTFTFTTTLLPLLLKTSEEPGSDVRIVTLASDAHQRGVATDPKLDFGNLDLFRNTWSDQQIPYFARYFISKLANVLFTKALQRRIASSSIICISLHPGLVNTSIAEKTNYPRLVSAALWVLAVNPDEGAYNSCFAAASPLVREDVEKYKGAYLEPVGKVAKSGANTYRVDMQDALWKTTEEYLKSLNLNLTQS